MKGHIGVSILNYPLYCVERRFILFSSENPHQLIEMCYNTIHCLVVQFFIHYDPHTYLITTVYRQKCLADESTIYVVTYLRITNTDNTYNYIVK